MSLLACSLLLCSPAPLAQRPEKLAETYAEAVDDVNRDHVRKPGAESEEELAEQLPKSARRSMP